MSQISLSIGIPAYNEAENIGVLLGALLSQTITKATLREIVVVSDGSEDATVTVARSIHDERIKVIDRKTRLGMNQTQNEIVRNVNGDILIMLNADVLPADAHMIDELIQPILKDARIGLVGGNTIPVNPHTRVGKVLNTGHVFKQNIYMQLSDLEMVYLCHGRVRAFTKELYSSMEWPIDCPEDAYSFLFAYTKGFHFAFARQAGVYFRTPQTMADHAKQSLRFYKGKAALETYFPKRIVDQAYAIPKLVFAKNFVQYLILFPLHMIIYVVITIVTRCFYPKSRVNITTWEVAHSSKKIL